MASIVGMKQEDDSSNKNNNNVSMKLLQCHVAAAHIGLADAAAARGAEYRFSFAGSENSGW